MLQNLEDSIAVDEFLKFDLAKQSWKHVIGLKPLKAAVIPSGADFVVIF